MKYFVLHVCFCCNTNVFHFNTCLPPEPDWKRNASPLIDSSVASKKLEDAGMCLFIDHRGSCSLHILIFWLVKTRSVIQYKVPL